MGVQVSVSINFTADSRNDAIMTVAGWTLKPGSNVTLMVEAPEQAVTQMVMEHVGTQDTNADGHIDVTPGTGGIEGTTPPPEEPPTDELPPDPPHPEHPIAMPDEPPLEEPPPPAPVAAFTYEEPDGGAGRNDVIPFDASGSTDATDYAWDFGDGGTDTGVTVTHAWTARGDFNVTLTVTGPGGTAQTTQTITVG